MRAPARQRFGADATRMEELQAGLQKALEGKRGRFARVVRGGTLRVGDSITVEPPA